MLPRFRLLRRAANRGFMSITKQQKKEFIEFFEKQFSETKEFCLADYKGLTVKDIEDLRKKLKALDASFYVIKNRLFSRVLKSVSAGGNLEALDKLSEHLHGPTALILEKGDQVKTTKQMLAFSKANEKFKIKACFMEGRCFTGGDVAVIASLSSREETLASLARTIAAPLANFGAVLSAPMRNMVIVLNAAAQKAAK